MTIICIICEIGLFLIAFFLKQGYLAKVYLDSKQFEKFIFHSWFTSWLTAISAVTIFFSVLFVFSGITFGDGIFYSPFFIKSCIVFLMALVILFLGDRNFWWARKYNRCQRKEKWMRQMVRKLLNDFGQQETVQNYINILEECLKENEILKMYSYMLLGINHLSEYHITAQLYKQILKDMKDTNVKMKKLSKEMKKMMKACL